MATPDDNRTTRKPFHLKVFLKSLTLKTVLKGARYAYLVYKAGKWVFHLLNEWWN